MRIRVTLMTFSPHGRVEPEHRPRGARSRPLLLLREAQCPGTGQDVFDALGATGRGESYASLHGAPIQGACWSRTWREGRVSFRGTRLARVAVQTCGLPNRST